ncbi:hypothetical protein RUM44_006629 [Polyplax serrata]|uniref:Peptidase M14 domain-containing protein n=1 Tax=Polyplax serrata TaxID=468196 RepID=A0ABR1AIP2_POLSC
MGDEDSDDSEGEGGMGNLNRLIIRPPGHSGKAKRGHLCFDASYETGNLGRVDLISEFEYDLFIRPDTCNPRARQWFNFSVDNTKVDQQEEKSLRARYDAHHQVDESTKMVRSFPLDTGRKQMRRIDVITITNPANVESSKKQRIVFILGRINPGDSPTSFACQGKCILDFLVSNHPIAVRLRSVVTFKIIPMMNPDGVFLGNYRSNLMGFDLNRNWHQLNEWAHPSLYAFDQMVQDLDSTKAATVDFILDLHASVSLPGVFVYGNTYDDVYRYERHILFPKLLAQNTEDYIPENTMYNRDALKVGTARRHFYSKLKGPTNCYTVEISFYGYQKKDTFNYKVYTEESCILYKCVLGISLFQ